MNELLNDPCMNNVRAETIAFIGDAGPGGGLTGVNRNVPVCEMNLEEDDEVLFHFVVTNTGSNPVVVFHCQPWAANSFVRRESFGPFATVNNFLFFKGGTAPLGWRADNDSNAFYAVVNVGGAWQRMAGPNQVRLSGDAKVAHMEWQHPQGGGVVRFEVRAVDTRGLRLSLLESQTFDDDETIHPHV